MKTNTKAVYKCEGCEEATITVELTTENIELQDRFNNSKPTCICGTNIPMYEDSRAVQIVK